MNSPVSIPALSRGLNYLPSQLIGRLRKSDESRVQALLEKAGDGLFGRPWLCPRTASLTAPEPVLQTFPHTGGVTALAVLPDGRALSGSQDHTLRLWDLTSGESRMLTGHTGGVTALAVLPDGRALSGSQDHTLRLWDLTSGESRMLTRNMDQVNTLAVLPDGRALSGSRYGSLRLWDLTSGESRVLTDWVTTLAVLPDGRALSGAPDRGVITQGLYYFRFRRWNLASGESFELKGQSDEVNALAVLPNGRRALSGGWTIILWDLDTTHEIAAFCSDASILSIAAVGEDCFIAGCANGAVHILDLVK